MSTNEFAVEAEAVTRQYGSGENRAIGVKDVSLKVSRGEVVAVTGPSGSGKSTLLFLLAGLDRPNEGTISVSGVSWESMRGKDRARFRRDVCGFIPQGESLLSQSTVTENVELPLLLAGTDPSSRRDRAIVAIERVGLSAEADKLPDQLSGGQQQRIAIARALIGEPAIVLADEPTGNLDSEAAQAVTRLLVEASVERSAGVVLVTHDPAVARHADRIVTLHSGRLHSDEATLDKPEAGEGS